MLQIALGEKQIRSLDLQAAAHPGARGCHTIQPSPQLPQLWWGCSLDFLLTHSPGPLPTLETLRSGEQQVGRKEKREDGAIQGLGC